MNAMFRKEFRDVVRWAPIGIILIAVLGWMSAPSNVYAATSTASSLLRLVGLGCGLIALALGLLQSLPELRNDVRGYLIHRPTTMTTIFWAKMLAGFSVYAICIVPTIIVLAIYFESIGPERLPTGWMDVIPATIMSLAIFVLHPAAIWTTAREAKWVGTRWFPLVFAVGGILLANLFLADGNWIYSLIAFTVVSVTIGCVVTAAALHAFTHQVFSPPPSAENRMSKSRAASLFVASAVVVIVPSALLAEFLSKQILPRAGVYHRITMDTDGRLWEVVDPATYSGSLSSNSAGMTGRPISGPAVRDSESLAALPDGWQERATASVPYRFHQHRLVEGHFTHANSLVVGDVNPQYYHLAQRRGRLYLYGQTQGLAGYVTPKGIYGVNETPEGRFDAPVIVFAAPRYMQVTGQQLIADATGVYQVDIANTIVRQIIDADIRGAVMVVPTKDQDAVVWASNASGLERHTLHAANSDEPLPFADSDVIAKTNSYPLPAVTSELTGRFTAPSTFLLTVAENAKGITALIDRTEYETAQYKIYSSDGSVIEEASVPLAIEQSHSGEGVTIALPPSLIAGTILFDDSGRSELLVPVRWLVCAHAALAMMLVQWLSVSLGLSRKQRLTWTVAAALAGLTVGVAMLAIYPRLVREKCARCEAARRVDTNRCEHCGADWDPPQAEGIEIISDGYTEVVRSPAMP